MGWDGVVWGALGRQVSENVKGLQRECTAYLEILSQYIDMIDYSSSQTGKADHRTRERERAANDTARWTFLRPPPISVN